MELVLFIHAIKKEKLLQARADDERDQNAEIAYMYIYVTVTKTDTQIRWMCLKVLLYPITNRDTGHFKKDTRSSFTHYNTTSKINTCLSYNI
mgnify:CR=1 FL=1